MVSSAPSGSQYHGIFERLSYYGAFASLARTSRKNSILSTQQTGTLTGIFGAWCGSWHFGGAVADKLGFRRALSMAYLILAAAYS